MFRKMSLVPDYDDSLSSSNSDENDSNEECNRQSEKAVTKPKLPKPDFMGNSINNDPDTLKTSVFKNPFAEAENAKEAILQKHVKMVDAKDNVVVINGKKICWNYRKGRCRFGHNCKFAHDSDIQKTKEHNEKQNIYQAQVLPQPSAQDLEKIGHDSVIQSSQKRKKRPGLTQGLVPGKRIMKNYINQK